MTEEQPKIGMEEVGQDYVDSIMSSMDNIQDDNTEEHDFLCEVCGKEFHGTNFAAFNAGWDYPPFLGMWRVVSPRTCGDCTIDKTAYWYLMTQGTENIPENHMATIQRILAEHLPHTDG